MQDALRMAATRAASVVGTVFQPMVTYEPPPTFHQTSPAVAAFQDIVDAYGEKGGRAEVASKAWGLLV
jgi:V-type H+-transporting ATPase subunit a